jgi:hypothetical protein
MFAEFGSDVSDSAIFFRNELKNLRLSIYRPLLEYF